MALSDAQFSVNSCENTIADALLRLQDPSHSTRFLSCVDNLEEPNNHQPHMPNNAFASLPPQVQCMLRNSLDAELRQYRRQAFASSTVATYKSRLCGYLRFCLFFGYQPVPCKPFHLLRYVVYLARTLSPTNIPCYLNVVHILHLQYGFPNRLEAPLFKNRKTLLIRGIMRVKSEPISQKRNILGGMLSGILLLFSQIKSSHTIRSGI